MRNIQEILMVTLAGTIIVVRENKKIPSFIENQDFYVVLLFFAVVPPGTESLFFTSHLMGHII